MVERLVNSEANARRMAAVENCFGASGHPLAIPGRVLFGEGVLTKICRKKAEPRQFFLFNDILVYGHIVKDKKKYNKQHIISLEEVMIENLEDDDTWKNGWLIKTPTKSFAVYAKSASEKRRWMMYINHCVDYSLKQTGKKPQLEYAAVWIPDAEAPICMHCQKTEFTVLNRRHHCRKCGSVVCHPCSSKKILLPAQSSKPLRVCLSCYDNSTNVGETPPKATEKSGNQDSSSEDDSQDEVDDEIKEASDAAAKDLSSLSLDDKPTFYADVTSSDLSRLSFYLPDLQTFHGDASGDADDQADVLQVLPGSYSSFEEPSSTEGPSSASGSSEYFTATESPP